MGETADRFTRWYKDKIDLYRQKYYSHEPLDKNARLLQHNGWLNVPFHPAIRLFLRIIERPGSILDLGCGNGLLLKTLRAQCRYDLVPFGADFLEESIAEARDEILPAFRNNFVQSNIDTCDLFQRRFTYIFTCPVYSHPDRTENFLMRCVHHLEPAGRLILYEYTDANILEPYHSIRDRSGTTLKGEMISDSFIRVLYFTSNDNND